jgi:hypothetical protein
VFNEANLKDNIVNIIVDVAHAILFCSGMCDDAIAIVAVDFIKHIKQYMFNTKLLSWEEPNKQRTDAEDKENVD